MNGLEKFAMVTTTTALMMIGILVFILANKVEVLEKRPQINVTCEMFDVKTGSCVYGRKDGE